MSLLYWSKVRSSLKRDNYRRRYFASLYIGKRSVLLNWHLISNLALSLLFNSVLFILQCSLSIVHCPLSFVHCPLSIVYCLLSIVNRPLSIVHCLLSIVHCPLSIEILSIVQCQSFSIRSQLSIVSSSRQKKSILWHFDMYHIFVLNL